MKRQVFFSFHYKNDVMRVQQIRNIGVLEGNEPVSPNQWEEVKKKGDLAIKKWIDDNMKNKSCVIVLVGAETAERKYVKYEIKKAWADGKGLFGIYIHNLKWPIIGKSKKGSNPFEQFKFKDGTRLSSVVKCYDPKSDDAYNDIVNNLDKWVEDAIKLRKR